MSRFTWWMYAVIGLVAIVGGGLVVTQSDVVGVRGVGGSLMGLGVVALALAVHFRPLSTQSDGE